MSQLSEALIKALDVNDVVQLTSELVAIESHRDAPGRERKCAEKIVDVFSGWGMPAELVPVLDERPNVVFRLKGTGGGSSLMLTGHIDTVPAYVMEIPPFEPEVRDGLLYGRGTVDMKGALACMMTAVRLLRDLKVPLKGDVIFAAVINEEDRSEGTEYLVRNGPKADRCVVGEPTELTIAAGHRGLEWLEFEFIGKAAHGGSPEKGVNAISMAARFIRRVEDELMPKLRTRTHPVIGSAVMNFGVIQGGTQPSSVADRCIVQLDRRWVPMEKLERVLGEYQDIIHDLEKEVPNFCCEMKRIESNMATLDHMPIDIPLDDPLVTGLSDVLRQLGIQEPQITAFGGWTDASLIGNYAHIPVLNFGPGELRVAHSRVEYVPVEHLRLATLAYALLANKICNQTL